MDYTALNFWFDIILAVLTVTIGIQNHFFKKQTATTVCINRIEEHLKAQIDAHKDRLTRVEENLKNSPTHTDLNRINDRINELNNSVNSQLNEINGNLREMIGQSKQISQSLDRLYQNELDKNK